MGTEVPRWRAWVLAIRPQTFPAGAAPVVVGTALAADRGVFAPGPALAALIGALLIQIGTNLANDYFDAAAGVDTEDRTGFTRATQAGLLAPGTVKRGAAIAFVLAILVGSYLVYIGGLPILIIGLVSVICGIAYAGGPYPLGSHGLGDLFVFIFFGLVAVVGTFYVQAAAVLASPPIVTIPPGTVDWVVVVASVPIACLATAILVVNNVRDIDTDRAAGKRTLAVIIGRRRSLWEFDACLLVAYLVAGWFVLSGKAIGAGLVYLSAPYALHVSRRMRQAPDGAALNVTLERTGKLLAAYAALFAVGVVVL